VKRIFIIPFLLIVLGAFCQPKSEVGIRHVLDEQTRTWNAGNIEGFMEGYWKNDSLMFIGKTGISWGWKNTLDRYKKSYPDTAAMGKLSFDILIMKELSAEYYYVVGKWALKRSIGDLDGYFNLLFKKINGQWFIVADHTS